MILQRHFPAKFVNCYNPHMPTDQSDAKQFPAQSLNRPRHIQTFVSRHYQRFIRTMDFTDA